MGNSLDRMPTVGYCVTKIWYVENGKHTIILRHNTTLGHKTVEISDAPRPLDFSANKNDDVCLIDCNTHEYELHVTPQNTDSWMPAIGGSGFTYSLVKVSGRNVVPELGQIVRQQAHKLTVSVTEAGLEEARDEDGTPHCVYEIRSDFDPVEGIYSAEDGGTGGSARRGTARRRFREFVELQEKVGSAYRDSSLWDNVPSLPMRMPKLIQDHSCPKFRAERRAQLSAWLERLVALPRACYNPDLLRFLALPPTEPPAGARYPSHAAADMRAHDEAIAHGAANVDAAGPAV
jgi:hypothetical protein